MVEALLKGFADPEIVNRLELSTLERQSAKFHQASGMRREGDIIYRIRTRNEESLFLYVMVEFQSYQLWWMALRMSTYTCLMYQHLVREGAVSGKDKLPCVLPIVLYNGEEPWEAPATLESLVVAPHTALEQYQLRHRYLLLDEQRLMVDAQGDNLCALLMALEQAKSKEALMEVVERLLEVLSGDAFQELRRTFALFIQRAILAKRGIKLDDQQAEDLSEVKRMLSKRLDEWEENWKQVGRTEGRTELLLEQLEQRFGPISEEDKQKVMRADGEALKRMGALVLTAKDLQEVLGDI